MAIDAASRVMFALPIRLSGVPRPGWLAMPLTTGMVQTPPITRTPMPRTQANKCISPRLRGPIGTCASAEKDVLSLNRPLLPPHSDRAGGGAASRYDSARRASAKSPFPRQSGASTPAQYDLGLPRGASFTISTSVHAIPPPPRPQHLEHRLLRRKPPRIVLDAPLLIQLAVRLLGRRENAPRKCRPCCSISLRMRSVLDDVDAVTQDGHCRLSA